LTRTATETIPSRSSQRLHIPVRKSSSMIEPRKETGKNTLKRQPTDDESASVSKKKPKLA
jgi:hypothetical protein